MGHNQDHSKHTNNCEKSSCTHALEELLYNQSGLHINMPYGQYKHMVCHSNANLKSLNRTSDLVKAR
jgi:hypothetical protein